MIVRPCSQTPWTSCQSRACSTRSRIDSSCHLPYRSLMLLASPAFSAKSYCQAHPAFPRYLPDRHSHHSMPPFCPWLLLPDPPFSVSAFDPTLPASRLREWLSILFSLQKHNVRSISMATFRRSTSFKSLTRNTWNTRSFLCIFSYANFRFLRHHRSFRHRRCQYHIWPSGVIRKIGQRRRPFTSRLFL